jgi:DNA-binding NarL/FixJ family response regulator
MLVRYTNSLLQELPRDGNSGGNSLALRKRDECPSAVVGSLTTRQRDVLKLMMDGKSNKGICRILNIAEPTVKNHVTAILKSLEVTNRTEAVIKVARASAFAPISDIGATYLGYLPGASPLSFRSG